MKLFGKEFKFNNNKVYHAGDKPTPSEIGAAASSHTHNYAGSSSAGGAANSANTLATARTINGTSFNGSANITTANWGTARTLTIGSTGKSVNGSGNVSWTLSEIGAAAASHTHSYLPLSGGTLTGRLTATGKISMPTTGSSWISGMTLTNAPLAITTQQSTSSYHPVLAVKTSGNHVANIGGLGDNFGFYGFKSGRTENATDWSFVFNASSGAVTSTAAITAPTFNGSLNGNAKTATSAATLTTARTINGTSFNGSANITTANWGTARNITIGNTAKSVNGSANVSWSLAEIGAASVNDSSTATTSVWSSSKTQTELNTRYNTLLKNIENVENNMAYYNHTHSEYLNVNGGTVNGYTYMKQGFIVHYAAAGGGTNGYIKVATIKNTGTYQNQSLYFKIAQRGRKCYNLEIRFGNADHSDPGVDLFEKDSGDVNAYLYKTSAGVWDLYIQKSESYDRIEILDYKKGSYMSGINITWSDVLASSVPSGYLTATTINSINSVSANGHWGMVPPDGNDNAWIRTTRQGIIPFQSGGNGSLGTSSWPFSNAYINNITAVNAVVSGQFNGETKFAQNSSYSDPWNGTGCAIKATGNIAATGIIRANQYLQVGGTPLSIQSSAPGVGGVWIQI